VHWEYLRLSITCLKNSPDLHVIDFIIEGISFDVVSLTTIQYKTTSCFPITIQQDEVSSDFKNSFMA